MKKAIRRTVAGISSLAMMAALSATTVPAFAAEYEAAEAQSFVDSFENSETREVAQFYLDNGVSYDELTDMMETYENGMDLLESRGYVSSSDGTIVMTGNYYSGTRVAQSQHYAAIVNVYPQATSSVNFTLTVGNPVVYNMASHPYTLMSDYSDLSVTVSKNNKFMSISGIIESSNITWADTIIKLPFAAGTANSEADLYRGFSLNVNYTSLGDTDGKYTLDTYALGDLDHNGIVDDADATLASDILVHNVTKIEYRYNDVGSEIASELFTLAFDTNEDGRIDITDAVRINQMAKK